MQSLTQEPPPPTHPRGRHVGRAPPRGHVTPAGRGGRPPPLRHTHRQTHTHLQSRRRRPRPPAPLPQQDIAAVPAVPPAGPPMTRGAGRDGAKARLFRLGPQDFSPLLRPRRACVGERGGCPLRLRGTVSRSFFFFFPAPSRTSGILVRSRGRPFFYPAVGAWGGKSIRHLGV